MDKASTLTQKNQAQLKLRKENTELISKQDTETLRSLFKMRVNPTFGASPVDPPKIEWLLPTREILNRLHPALGESFADIGHDQERNRGALLLQLACQRLGYADNHYNGQFLDIRRQLLEVKLQTSPTIDLGLVKPDSTEMLDLPEKIQGGGIQPCDVR